MDIKSIFIIILISTIISNVCTAQEIMEYLDRGATIIPSNNGVLLSWRIYGTENLKNIEFNIYKNSKKINSTPINVSNYLDKSGNLNSDYSIHVLNNGAETGEIITKFLKFTNPYITINLKVPNGGTTPDGVTYTYSPNDCSVGDIDGDGEYEIFLKWDPSNSKDNSQKGYTGNVYIDSYKLDGTFLWRIDLGKNIRAGAHYTQFLVYDFDGNGKAELICKTAPGTKDGQGNYLSTGPASNDDDFKDYRNSNGYVLSGPEYITVFNGQTGAEMATVNYLPQRGSVSSWGDSYGNRVDRFVACVAYLDGQHPSAVFERGYYTRMTFAAWDWNGKTLNNRWLFDSNNSDSKDAYGQGNHNLSVADVDDDGKDEIIQGSCAIDDNGKLLYSTKLGHGDAIHLGDLDPNRPGLEVWEVHEEKKSEYGYEMHDAKTGEIIWGSYTGTDNGRGLAADIDSTHIGYEMWSFGEDGIYDCKGNLISSSRPSINFRMYWDGDFYDEILDGTKLDKWTGNGTKRLVSFYQIYDIASNNSTKQNPGLVADIFGDWREEVIYRSSDNSKLVIFTTNIPTDKQMYTLMHDPVYRMGIAWQNSAYNQPPHLGFWLAGKNIPTPNIKIINHNIIDSANIIYPSARSEYFVGNEITLKSNITTNKKINSVQFYCRKGGQNNIENIGKVYSFPYNTTWIPKESGIYIVYLKAFLDNGEIIVSPLDYKLIISDKSTKILNKYNNNKGFSIYPNPVINNKLFIKFSIKDFSKIHIEIYNLNGILINKKIIDKNYSNNIFNLSDMIKNRPKGCYYIIVKPNNRRKLIFKQTFYKY